MKKITVLLVEDNEADIILTTELLAQLEIEVDIKYSKDGEDAIMYLLKEKNYHTASTPDLVLLDINLPKKNGKEILAFIKNNNSLKSIPVIMYTSSTLETDILYCHSQHIALYLNKANSIENFLQNIETIKEYFQKTFKY